MLSMTGFGHYEYSNNNFVITMEIKSYNNRYLDISYSAPPYLSFYEAPALNKVKERIKRGRLDVQIKVKNLKDSLKINVDEGALQSYVDAAKRVLEISKASGLHFDVQFSDIFNAEGVLSEISEDAEDKYREGLDFSLDKCLDMLVSFKEREGEETCQDLKKKIGNIHFSLEKIKACVSEMENMIKTSLLKRIHEMELDDKYDESRILTEVSVMLMRYTVNEEVVRLETHIREFGKLLESAEPVGKKLDFLCQEMNREVNTIGSKSQMVEVNLEVVKMKDNLENIREEIRNIE